MNPRLQERYAPVTEAPQVLKELSQQMRLGNTRSLLRLMLEDPAGQAIGTYQRERGVVCLRKPVWWTSLSGKRTRRRVVSHHELKLATSALRTTLKQRQLPYAVWKSSRPETPQGSAPNEAVPVKIGFVDTRRPLREGTTNPARAG